VRADHGDRPTTEGFVLCSNDFQRFPGRWGELADLLRQTQVCLEEADAAGVRTADLAAVSRAARHAVKDADRDVDRAVDLVGRVVLDARSLLSRTG
jgi:hypothetical protein